MIIIKKKHFFDLIKKRNPELFQSNKLPCEGKSSRQFTAMLKRPCSLTLTLMKVWYLGGRKASRGKQGHA